VTGVQTCALPISDPDRTGMLPFVFEDGFGFERYVDYALDVPMYFVKRGSTYHNVAGSSFRDFLDGKLEALPGVLPTMDDWIDHLTTLFPEVRMKQFLEMRGCDGGPWRSLCAMPALWVGLLYDDAALDAAWDLVKDWTADERQALRDDVPKLALKAPIGNTTAGEIAKSMLEISKSGLKARNQRDGLGRTEELFLSALDEIVSQGRTPAEEMLAKFANEWHGDIDQVFSEYAY